MFTLREHSCAMSPLLLGKRSRKRVASTAAATSIKA
jgi:hypothetical protein